MIFIEQEVKSEYDQNFFFEPLFASIMAFFFLVS